MRGGITSADVQRPAERMLPGMLEVLIALCLPAVSAGIFLRVGRDAMLPAAVICAVLGTSLFLLGQGAVPADACCAIGLSGSAAYIVLREKRPFIDGFLVFSVGECQLGLWTAFQRELQTVCEGDIVLFLYCLFYLLHVPAVLLTFDSFRLPRDWRTKIKGPYSWWIPALSLGMLLMIGAVSALPVFTAIGAVTKILLATAVFWLSLAVMALLAICWQKREQNTAESHYHADMNTFMDVVRSQRHDYNLHVQTVAGLIAQQKWEECRSYVNALVQDTNRMNAVLPVKDPAIAALIHNYRMLAAQSGITLVLDIRDDMADVVTSAYETNKIIGNLLQNALDELLRQPDPGEIELTIFKRGEYCLVRVSNRVDSQEGFADRREEIFRQGFTTKQGHDGVGLSSIRALARQSGGDVSAWTEGDVVHFVASIPVRLALE